jgi:non-homologous end joining protein Ku
MIGHRGWPYPTTKTQVIRVIVVATAIVLVSSLATLLWSLHVQSTPQSSDDLKQQAQSLLSYAREARLLIDTTADQPLTSIYRDQYSEKLQENVKNVAESISGRDVQSDVTTARGKLQGYASQLQQLVKPLTSDATRVDDLGDRIQHIEESL